MNSITRERAAEIDRLATQSYGVPSLLLMECAGRTTAGVVLSILDQTSSGSVWVLAGPGNNGADGFAVARHVFNRIGGHVRILLAATHAQKERRGEAAQTQHDMCERLGIPIETLTTPEEIGASSLVRSPKDVLWVDALLGVGQRGALRDPAPTLLRVLNSSGRPILAVDMPSGVDANTGEAAEEAIRAHTTVTFGLPKVGLTRSQGPEHAGRILVAEIGFPRPLLDLPADRRQDEVMPFPAE